MIDYFQSCARCNSITSDDMCGGRCNAWYMSDEEEIFMTECGLMICNLCWNTRGTYCVKCKSELSKAEEQRKEKNEKRKMKARQPKPHNDKPGRPIHTTTNQAAQTQQTKIK